MGGTSTDVATVIGGQPQWTTGSTVDGLPIGLAAFDIHTVGARAAGRSPTSTRAARARRPPLRAGAAAGARLLRARRAEPTVTDANVLLGRVVTDDFAGGTIRIDADLARRAIEPLAGRMNKSAVEARLGVLRVAEDNMAHRAR